MNRERRLPVRSGLPASHPCPSLSDAAKQGGKADLPPCLFYDSVTQFFCMLRKRPNHDRGSLSCVNCSWP
jgi:hypothetical protein